MLENVLVDMSSRAPEGWAEEAERGDSEDSLRRFLRLQVSALLHVASYAH